MKELCPSMTSTPMKKNILIKGRESYREDPIQNSTISTVSRISETTRIMNHSASVDRREAPLKIALCLVIGIFLGYYIPLPKTILYSQNFPSEQNTKQFSLHSLRSRYDSVKSIVFDELESAVNLIHRTETPLSFVFAHSNKVDLYEVTLALCNDVGILASNYLGNGTVITIKSDTMDTHSQADYGCLLSQWRRDIEQSRVVVVRNLQLVPEHLAPVFHTLCDQFTPYVPRALYLHTVDVGARAASRPPGCEHCAAVTQRLRQAWPALSVEVFEPLMTRIATSVLTVG